MKLNIFLVFLFLLILGNGISAFGFNGTVYDINGNPLNNTLINITIRDESFNVIGSNFTYTNASGWFDTNISTIANSFYEPLITWTNQSTGTVQYVGQSLPAFPAQMLAEVSGTSFYLKEAGTINITAINSTGGRISFMYQVKDQKLGYPIAMQFSSAVSGAKVIAPRDRNYSIMVYPEQSMPVSFNWDNFSATNGYVINTLSTYNFTTKTLHYQFNTTMNIVRVSGYINYSGIEGWNEFTIIPYILEPGSMVHAEYGDMPYNISAMSGESDTYNVATGFYNISLPSTPAETSNILLFASARNGSEFYGGFRNISNLGSAGLNGFNFSHMSGLFGDPINLTMESLFETSIGIPSAKQTFNLLNSTNGSLTNINGHIEVTVDYSNLGATESTWMLDIFQGGNAGFTLPLLNNSGIKEMNLFVEGGDYAPKRVSYTASQLIYAQNISFSNFNPGDIDRSLDESQIFMGLIISNSSCDVPSISEGCFVGGINGQGLDEFNPMKAIIGGGRLSFVMGTSSIKVHYVNVDMLASGPPDALFESSTSESTSGTFESALRFGSQGPTIYDYALVTIPYTEGGSSTTGLNESGEINISIPLLYDDDWNVIWNATVNGTNASALAGNYSHYSARKNEWQVLLQGTTCHENGATAASINATHPCYIDKTNNKIVLRIPHFSGTGPKITGSVISASSSDDSSSSSSSGGGGGGGGTVPIPKATYLFSKITPSNALVVKDISSKIGIKEIKIEVKNEAQNVKITIEKYSEKPSAISKEKSGKVNQYIHINAENLKDKIDKAIVKFRVEKTWVSQNNVSKENIVVSKFDETNEIWNDLKTEYSGEDDDYYYYLVELNGFSYFAISEKSVVSSSSGEGSLEQGDNGTEGESSEENSSANDKGALMWWVIWIIVLIILIILGVIGYRKFKGNN